RRRPCPTPLQWPGGALGPAPQEFRKGSRAHTSSPRAAVRHGYVAANSKLRAPASDVPIKIAVPDVEQILSVEGAVVKPPISFDPTQPKSRRQRLAIALVTNIGAEAIFT